MSVDVTELQQDVEEYPLTLKVIKVYPLSHGNENLPEVAEQHGISLMNLTAAQRYTDGSLYLRSHVIDDILNVHKQIQEYHAETLVVVVDHEIAGKIVISVNAVFIDAEDYMLFKLKHWNDNA